MILVVEDHKTLRLMIVKGLKKEGFEVIDAENGKEALALLEKIEPELIVSDVRMPEMDGFEFLGKVREKNKIIPFIFLTVLDDLEDYQIGYNLGADGYITKPFEIDELVEKIKRKLRKSKILKEIISGKRKEVNLDDISISDIVEIGDKNERKIFVESGKQKGEFIIQNGEIKNATFEDLKGEKAIAKVLSLKSGKIKFV